MYKCLKNTLDNAKAISEHKQLFRARSGLLANYFLKGTSLIRLKHDDNIYNNLLIK
jgi:hypothetical protein